ncbi:MAG: flagellar hook-basal body complex protein FliE [Thiotrichales bacterium]
MEVNNANQLLQQLQSMARQAKMPEAGVSSQLATSGEFGNALRQSIRAVNDQQKKSGALSAAFEREDPRVDLAQVMIEGQKSKLAFEALLQVRNRLVTAYQDIMRMPV